MITISYKNISTIIPETSINKFQLIKNLWEDNKNNVIQFTDDNILKLTCNINYNDLMEDMFNMINLYLNNQSDIFGEYDINKIVNLITCANWLGNDDLCNILADKLAHKIDTLSVEELRDSLGYDNDEYNKLINNVKKYDC